MKTLSILLLVVAVSGCSALAGKTQQFSVTASPAHAKININGMNAGTGHATMQVKRDSTISVMVTADGCETMHRAVGNHMNALAVLDGVGTLFFLFPAVGLATAGAHSIDEDSIHMSLPCKEEGYQTTTVRPPSPAFHSTTETETTTRKSETTIQAR